MPTLGASEALVELFSFLQVLNFFVCDADSFFAFNIEFKTDFPNFWLIQVF